MPTNMSGDPRQGGVQYDEQGRPYVLMSDGTRNYISPAAFGQAPPPDETGIFRQAPQWDNRSGEWETPIDWTNIANIAVGTGLGLGGADAFGLLGLGSSPSAAVPAAETASTAGTTAAVAGPSAAAEVAGVDAAIASMAPSTAATTAGTVAAGEATRRIVDAVSNPADMITPGYNMTPDINGVSYDSSGNVAGQGGGGVMGWLNKLNPFANNSSGDTINRLLGAAGAGIGGATDAAAHNRGQTLQAMEAQEGLRQSGRNLYENQLMNREDMNMKTRDDAFTKAIQSQRIMNSTGYKTPMISQTPGARPTALPNFGTGMAAPSSEMKNSASTLYNEVQKRLEGGSQLPPLPEYQEYTADPELLKQSGGERIGNWLSPALTGLTPPVQQPTRDPYRGR